MRKVFRNIPAAFFIFSLAALMIFFSSLAQVDALTGTSMVYGSDAIAKYLKKGDHIYFGQVADGYTGSSRWRVGNPSGSNTGGSGAIFLISEYTWRGPGGTIAFNSNYEKENAQIWEGSDAQKWCQDFYAANFSESDKSHIAVFSKTEAAGNWLYINFGENSISASDRVFFLSAEEVWRYLGQNSASKELRVTDINGTPTAYWLRSPRADNRYQVGDIDGVKGGVGTNRVDQTQVYANNVLQDYAARPALNVKTDDLLLISAVGAKDSDVGVMSSVSSDASDFKLTYLDSSRCVQVSGCENNGSVITAYFTEASTGSSRDYVSAIIEKNGRASYYGKFANNASNGTVEFPSSLIEQGSELYIFSERCNGPYETDYASAFIKVDIPEYIPPEEELMPQAASDGTVTANASESAALSVKVKSLRIKAAKKKITVRWKQASKKTQGKISGYQVQIAKSPDFSNAKTYKAGKKAKNRTVKKLSRKTTYYVRIRAYKGACYGSWSAVKKVKTK